MDKPLRNRLIVWVLFLGEWSVRENSCRQLVWKFQKGSSKKPGKWLVFALRQCTMRYVSFTAQQFLDDKKNVHNPHIHRIFHHVTSGLFLNLKLGLKSDRFASIEIIKANVATPIKGYRICFKQLQIRWSKCVCADGRYFERD